MTYKGVFLALDRWAAAMLFRDSFLALVETIIGALVKSFLSKSGIVKGTVLDRTEHEN
jgi:hypothetical protein